MPHMNMSEQELKIGDIGYKFRKKFDEGWFTGSVVSIRPGAGKSGLRHDMHVFYMTRLAHLLYSTVLPVRIIL